MAIKIENHTSSLWYRIWLKRVA